MNNTKTTVHLNKELISEYKKLAAKIVGYDLFISSEQAFKIVINQVKKNK